MRRVVAHKGCEQRGENVRGVYVYAKLYTSAMPIVLDDGRVEFDASGDWGNPLYAYEIVCFDCDQSILVFTDEVETYKLDYAFRNYPGDYNVEVIEVES